MVRQSGISIINLLVLTGLGILCLWTAVNSPSWWRVLVSTKQCKDIVLCIPWGGTRAVLQGCTIFSWLLSLVSASYPFPDYWICSLVLAGVHGGWVKPISYKQEMGDTDFVPRGAPLGPAPFQYHWVCLIIQFSFDHLPIFTVVLQQAGSWYECRNRGRGQVAGNHTSCKQWGLWADKGKRTSKLTRNYTFWVLSALEADKERWGKAGIS